MDNLIELRFDAKRYAYWQKVEVRDSVDDLCSSTQLAITIPADATPLALDQNTVAEVLINDVLVSTVRMDMVRRRVNSTSHDISLVARSLGRELVDCQYSKTLSGLKLGEIVKRLCEAFKVPVTLAADTAIVPHFSMQSEIPANALLNAVRAANLLLYPLPDGGLILTEPTSAPPVATLTYGENIKSYEVVDEYKLRFSEYLVKSFDYDNNRSQRGAVKDDALNFFRPMHIIADRHGQGLGGLERRATLERNRRMARAKRIELELKDWGYTDGNGKFQPWAVNTQVRVVIEPEGIDDIFLIGDRTKTQDDRNGSVTSLSVMHRNAFIGEEKKQVKRGAGIKKARP